MDLTNELVNALLESTTKRYCRS